jgi:hypothetical protein
MASPKQLAFIDSGIPIAAAASVQAEVFITAEKS